jgi:hypothetical protein
VNAALAALVEHLQRDGLPARLGEDCAYLGIGSAAVVVPWYKFDSNGKNHSAALVAALRLRDTHRVTLFYDEIAELGSSRQEAAVRALLMWYHGALAPVLPLLGGPTGPEVKRFDEDSEVHCPPWVIYSGPYLISGPQGGEVARLASQRPLLATLRGALAHQLAGRNEFHWMKLYWCRDKPTRPDIKDCYVDGKRWEPGMREARNWELPALDGRHTFRQFLVLLPPGRQPNELMAEALAVLDIREAVYRAVPVFASNPDCSPQVLIRALERAGISPELAVSLAEFMPLAFNRVILANMGLRCSDFYVRVDESGRERRRAKLLDEPVYREVRRMLPRVGTEDGDAARAVAVRSPELETLYTMAQEEGLTEFEGVELPPPVLAWAGEPEEPDGSTPT